MAPKPAPLWVQQVSLLVVESLFTVLFPSDCRICGLPLTNVSRLPVCVECLAGMSPTTGQLCSVCGERLVSVHASFSPDGEVKCGLCRRTESQFERAVAYGSFEGGLRDLIHLLKYSGVRPAANVLGRMLAEAIAEIESLFSGQVAVVPVPLFRSRRRQREFNQAELIARATIRLLPRPGHLQLRTEILERKRETASQAGLTSHQRRANVRGAFAVAHPDLIQGQEVLVVDDVYTTGATVSECARVLRRAGATKVWVATVARTMKNSQQQVKVILADESPTGYVPLAAAPAG
jgi:ComF family protein